MSEVLRRITEHSRFRNFIVGTIFCSSLLVGLESYPVLVREHGDVLRFLDQIVLAIFTVEIVMRIGAHGRTPWRFFTSGWNLFDFTIVAVCYLPSSQFVAVLRLARILRILRLVAPIRESEVIRRKNKELEEAYQKLAEEQAKSERLLLNVLPSLIAQRLKSDSSIIADSFPDASVLFSDIVDFTRLSQRVAPETLIEILDLVFSRFDQLAAKHGLEKIKTIGDAYMVVAGIPEPRPDHAEAIAEMALDMIDALGDVGDPRVRELNIRAGIQSGPVIAGVIGRSKFIYDLWGDTVNTASRMESHGEPGRIHVAEATYELLKHRYRFEDRGIIEVKGKGPMHTYFLLGRR